MVLTNNETGEVVHDMDLCALIGAAQTENDATAAIGLTACNSLEIAATIAGALKAVKQIKVANPEAAMLCELMLNAVKVDVRDTDEE